jgi:Lrp/AsnC family transcriptional regulator for asnA, asnC and gidA
MDSLDLRIAEMLADDGRMTNSEIARRLNVSEGTIRQRLKRMIDAGQLRIQPMLNGDLFPNRYLAVIGLQIEGQQLEKCAQEVDQLPEVLRTLIVTGRYDLLVFLLLDSHAAMVDFVTHKLSRVHGIRESETFVCLKNSDPWFAVNHLRGAAGKTAAAE